MPDVDTVPSAFDAGMRWQPPPNPRRARQMTLTLRPIDDLPLPTIDEVAQEAGPLIASDPPTLGHGALTTSTELSRKIAKRAAVRRARLRDSDPAECTDVLVLESEEASLVPLRTLLQGFGFRVVVATDVPHAVELTANACFAAAFVDIPLDDAAGGEVVDLCRALKSVRRSPGGLPAALVLYSAHVSPIAWIRAQLAGCDVHVAVPAQRGDLARALESCAVALPSDARRS